jgi:hypothetical protein
VFYTAILYNRGWSHKQEDWTIEVGRVEGANCALDIAPFVEPGQRFRFIKLTDAQAGKSNDSAWPGADIDAVGALNTLPVSSEAGQ